MKIIIPKNVWKYYVEKPDSFINNPDLFIERLAYSLEKEGYLNFSGSLEFENTVSQFLLDYKGFFEENFVDIIIRNVVTEIEGITFGEPIYTYTTTNTTNPTINPTINTYF